MKIIENKKILLELKNNIRNCIRYIIPETYNVPTLLRNISLVIIKDLDSDIIYLIPVNHSDFESKIEKDDIVDFFKDISSITISSKDDYHILGQNICVDINIVSYVSSLEFLDISSTYENKYVNFYRNQFDKLRCINNFVPSHYFLDVFDSICQFCESIPNFKQLFQVSELPAYSGMFRMNMVLSLIEKNGIYIDSDLFKLNFDPKFHGNIIENKLYSEYSLFTSTGRPSNKFGGINFAALNKKDDTRKCFVSRFGNDGMLVDIDFQACHPHLIANLIGYTIPDKLNIYEYLGKYYYNADSLTDDQILESKNITFRQLYGQVESKFKDIPFFKKKIEYNNKMMDDFNKNGYIETPLYKRHLSHKNFEIDSSEKMFAYLLQSYETEINLKKCELILRRLQHLQSKLILYTYDSFLIDFCKQDGVCILNDIKMDLESDNMPISINVGRNYKDLKKITI